MIQTIHTLTHIHRGTHLNVVLHEVGGHFILVLIEDLVEYGASLTVFLQQEEAGVAVLRGSWRAAVFCCRTLIWNTESHTFNTDSVRTY